MTQITQKYTKFTNQTQGPAKGPLKTKVENVRLDDWLGITYINAVRFAEE